MTRDDIRNTLAQAVGNPTTGPIAEALDTLTDAIDSAINTKPSKEKRVLEPTETRDDTQTLP